jgi:integrase
LIRRSGLPRIRLHDLRHAHATHLLTTNIHPKVVQERLGHASIRMTLDLYSHVLLGMQESAAADLDVAIRAAMQKVAKR